MMEPKRVADSRTTQVQILGQADLNGYLRLFGGQLLRWIDVLAAVVARRHANRNVTTACIDHLDFLGAAHANDTIILDGRIVYTGTTSMEVCVETFVESLDGTKRAINRAHLVMVALDENEKPTPVPPLLIETPQEKADWEAGRLRHQLRQNKGALYCDMSVFHAIRSRRSIRKFVPEASVTDEQLHSLLEAAMMAPSACNVRPWEFVVVRSEETRCAVADALPYCRHLKQAPLAIVVCGRPETETGICEGFWPQDVSAATENTLLEAVGLGLGTCWCGVYPSERMVSAPQKILEIDSVPMGVIVVGVPAEFPAARGGFDETKVLYR